VTNGKCCTKSQHKIRSLTSTGTSPLPQNSCATCATAALAGTCNPCSPCSVGLNHCRSLVIANDCQIANNRKGRQRLLSTSEAAACCILTIDTSGFRSITSEKCLLAMKKLSLWNTSSSLTTEIGITNGSNGTDFGI
jgi:hypothetical protein